MAAVNRFLPGCCLLLACAEAVAQGVMAPPAVHAIESHLQQERTRQQREAMEAQRAVPLPSRPATPYPPQAVPQATPSRFQNLDNEAIFERPAPPRTTRQPKRKVAQ